MPLAGLGRHVAQRSRSSADRRREGRDRPGRLAPRRQDGSEAVASIQTRYLEPPSSFGAPTSHSNDEPATGAQLSYLQTLAEEAGEDVPDGMTKAEASEMIDRLCPRARCRQWMCPAG